MAKIVFSAYSKTNLTNTSFKPINSDDVPTYTFDDNKSIYNLLYLPNGVTITAGGFVSLQGSQEANSAYLPGEKNPVRISDNFVTAQNTVIESGGKLILDGGAIASGTILKDKGSTENVNFGWKCTLENNKISFEGRPPVQASSLDAQVSSGASQVINGGVASGTSIFKGGTQTVKGHTITKGTFLHPYSESKEGSACNTAVYSGGSMIVSSNGVASYTKVNGGSMSLAGKADNTTIADGKMTVLASGSAHNILLEENAALQVNSGATLSGILYLNSSKNFTISSNVKTDDLVFCFDFSNGASDDNSVILTQDIYKNLSDNTTYSVYCSKFTTDNTFNLINVNGIFDKSISISNGNLLTLDTKVYDDLGNSYILRYDDVSNDYTVEFDNEMQFQDIHFYKNSTSANSNTSDDTTFLRATDLAALYGSEIEIFSTNPNITISDAQKNEILNSLSGTLIIQKGSQTLGTLNFADGMFYGKRILIESMQDKEIRYIYKFKTDKTFDFDFSIRAAVSSIVLSNTNSNDDKWQSLAQDYILSGNSLSVKNEYIGYNDIVDYRRVDFENAGLMDLNIEVNSLTGSEENISISVYKTTLDGSYSQLMTSFYQPVSAGSISIKNIAVTKGSYYIEIKANNTNPAYNISGAVNYELNINNTIFDQPAASNNDDSAAKSKYYFANEALSAKPENSSLTEWVGPGDTVDYRFINIDASGKYSFTIKKELAENTRDISAISAAIVKVTNGYEQIVATSYLGVNNTEHIFKDLLLDKADNVEYYFKLTNNIPANQIDYSVKMESSEIYTDADRSDDSFANAKEYSGPVGNGNSLTENNYLGYGDTVDYIKFTVSEAGRYSVSIENNLAYGASAILYKESSNGTNPVYVTSTGSTYMPKNGNFYAVSAEVELFAGTYYLQISGGNNYNSSGNTTYTAKLNGGTYQALADSNGIFNQNQVYSLNVKEKSNVIIDSSLYSAFYVYTEGPYGQQYVPFNEYTVFEAGKTYYFKAYQQKTSTSGVTIQASDANPLESGNSITASANVSDTVDYYLIDVNSIGEYSVTFNQDKENRSYFVEFLEYANGYMRTVKSVSSNKNVFDLSTNIIPADNANYYLRVTCYNPQQNHDSEYTISFNSKPDTRADRSDDTAATAKDASVENGYLINNNYLGYGDTTDYIKFNISEAGKYSITLESSLAYGANATLYRLNENGSASAINLAYISATGSTYNKTGDKYTATSWETELLTGTYYLQISGGSNYTDTLNTSYSVKLNNNFTYQSLLSSQNTFYANTAYTLNVNEKSNIILNDSSLYYRFNVYTDNGANGHSWVSFNRYTIFSPGTTYYFVPNTTLQGAFNVTPLDAMSTGSSRKDKVDKLNSVDYFLLDINKCGEYSLSLDKIIPENGFNNNQLLLEIVKVTNSATYAIGSAYIMNNQISGEIKNICIDPTDGSSYYYRVTYLNSYLGDQVDYKVSLNGNYFDADPSNNSYDTASQITVSDKNNITIAQKDYLGFGDTTDYFTFNITEDGQYALLLESELRYGANVTLYKYNETYNYMQYVTASGSPYLENQYAESEKFYCRTNVTALSAGKYYAVVNGGSAYNSTLNTTYSLQLININARSLTDSPERFDLNEYATLNTNGESDIYYAEISGSQYTLYYEGTYGLTAVYPYNGKLLIDSNKKYYIKSNANDNYLNFTAESIVNNAENTYDSSSAVHFESKSNWIGLNDAADSWEFDTFGSETADGASRWEVITVKNLRDTVGASTHFNITLYKEVNGSWVWAGSSYANYNAYTDTETAGKLSVNLEADTRYKVEVSTSDNGAGNCAGYFDFSRDIYEYDLTNNTFQTATALEDTAKGTVTFAGDSIDIYEVNAAGSFELKLDTEANTGAAVRVSFYDQNYNAVYLPGKGTSVSLNLYNNNIAFEFANGGEDIKFIKVEAAGGLVNSYNISQKA